MRIHREQAGEQLETVAFWFLLHLKEKGKPSLPALTFFFLRVKTIQVVGGAHRPFPFVFVQGDERLHDAIKFLVPERQEGREEEGRPLFAVAIFEERPEAGKLSPVVIIVSPEVNKEALIHVALILDVPFRVPVYGPKVRVRVILASRLVRVRRPDTKCVFLLTL